MAHFFFLGTVGLHLFPLKIVLILLQQSQGQIRIEAGNVKDGNRDLNFVPGWPDCCPHLKNHFALLNCEGFPRWFEFLQVLRSSSDLCEPSVQQLAFDLILPFSNLSNLNEPFMVSLELSQIATVCSQQSIEGSEMLACPAGLIAAVYVASLSKSRYSRQLLVLFRHLAMKVSSFDFLIEESSWPVSPLDLFTDGTCLGLTYSPWARIGDSVSSSTMAGISTHANFRHRSGTSLEVWDLGDHIVLSAEALTALGAAARSLDMQINIRRLFVQLYPSWATYHYVSLFQKGGVDCPSLLQHSPLVDVFQTLTNLRAGVKELDIELFSRQVDRAARNFRGHIDLLMITSPPMLMLSVVLASRTLRLKNMILYTSAFPYHLVPAGSLQLVESLFMQAARDPNRIFAVQDTFNAYYIDRSLGVVLPVVHGLTLYTGVASIVTMASNRTTLRGLLVHDRQFDDVLRCVLERLYGNIPKWLRPSGISFRRTAFISFHAQASYSACAIFPYTYYNLAFEEVYQMGIPIFIPLHLTKHNYFFTLQAHIFRNLGTKYVWDTGKAKLQTRFANIERDQWQWTNLFQVPLIPWDVSKLRDALAHSEYFTRPHILYFRSLLELLTLAANHELLENTRNHMRNHNARTRSYVLSFWRGSLLKILAQ